MPRQKTVCPPDSLLMDVRAVALRLNCSWRHVYRMADQGLMPKPVKLGALVRWQRQKIEDWISKGCQKVV